MCISFKYKSTQFNESCIINRVFNHLAYLFQGFFFYPNDALNSLIAALKYRCIPKFKEISKKCNLMMEWTPPNDGWLKWSIFSVSSRNSFDIAGILHNHQGNCLYAFSLSLLPVNSSKSDVILINIVIDLCKVLHLSNAFIEVTSTRLLNWISGLRDPPADIFNLMMNTRNKIRDFPVLEFVRCSSLHTVKLIAANLCGIDIPLDDFPFKVRCSMLLGRISNPLNPFGDDSSGLPERTNDSAGAYAKACIGVATELNIPVIDIWSKMQQFSGWEKSFLSDGLHFTASGNKILFEEVVTKLKETGISVDTLPVDLPLFCEIDPKDPLKSFGK